MKIKVKRFQTRRRQKGGNKFLKFSQHIHLKNTMVRLGPEWHKIEDVWNYANSIAKKPSELINNPQSIFDYVFDKTLSPANDTWSLLNNEYIRYIPHDNSVAITHKNKAPNIFYMGSEKQ